MWCHAIQTNLGLATGWLYDFGLVSHMATEGLSPPQWKTGTWALPAKTAGAGGGGALNKVVHVQHLLSVSRMFHKCRFNSVPLLCIKKSVLQTRSDKKPIYNDKIHECLLMVLKKKEKRERERERRSKRKKETSLTTFREFEESNSFFWTLVNKGRESSQAFNLPLCDCALGSQNYYYYF